MLPTTTTFSRIWNLSPSTLDELRREFDNAVGSVGGAVTRTCVSQPPVSIWESDEKLVAELDVPGVQQSDLAVSVEDGVLTVTGTRKASEHSGEQKHADFRCDSFSRSIRLHESLDPESVEAELDSGVLTLSISRRAEAQPRTIPVKVHNRQDKTLTDASSNESA